MHVCKYSMNMSRSIAVTIVLLGLLAGASYSQSTNMTCVDQMVSEDVVLQECIGLMNSVSQIGVQS